MQQDTVQGFKQKDDSVYVLKHPLVAGPERISGRWCLGAAPWAVLQQHPCASLGSMAVHLDGGGQARSALGK